MRLTRRTASLLPLAVALAVALAACGPDATAPARGSLFIQLDAMSPGVQPAVTVTGPRGFSRTVASSDTVEGLAPGTYTVAAAEVTAGGARYRASPQEQTVEVPAGGLARAALITYAVASARLAVSVLGLPAGSAGSVTVSGPAGYSRTVASTTSLDLLEPGSYAIAASDVQAAGKTYHAVPATQAVTLSASTAATSVVVWYGGGSGVLDLAVAGLPAGSDAAVTVTGPGGFARTLTSSSTLRYLEPGTYTIAAAVVGSDLTTYRPAATSQTLELGDGATASATVTYGGSPLELALAPVADGLAAPVFLTAPDGDARLFIVEREGRVRIVEDGALLPTPFLDIRDRVNFTGERGLLGMAFPPTYATSGYFYVYYVDRRGDVALERIASVPGSDVAAGSAGLVITIPHGGAEHHGGMIAFGPDGMLHLAPGDGRCCGDPDNNAQNLKSLLGKLLRIDVRTRPYGIPPSNPFAGQTGRRREIWAYGLRNPWRFSFDEPAGMLYIGDVGQDAREEVNASPASAAGLNYGWPLMEGTACYNPTTGCDAGGTLTLPVHEYLHSDGCSVTGGYVYRGPGIPELAGHYVYADYCRGWLRSFRLTTSGATDHRSWAGVSVPRAVSFGRDGAGELYVIGASAAWRIVRR